MRVITLEPGTDAEVPLHIGPGGDVEELGVRSLGIYVKAVREARGMSQTELAKTSDISGGYLSQIESGSRNSVPSPATLDKISAALGLRPRTLYVASGLVPPPEPQRTWAVEATPLTSPDELFDMLDIPAVMGLPPGWDREELEDPSRLAVYGTPVGKSPAQDSWTSDLVGWEPFAWDADYVFWRRPLKGLEWEPFAVTGGHVAWRQRGRALAMATTGGSWDVEETPWCESTDEGVWYCSPPMTEGRWEVRRTSGDGAPGQGAWEPFAATDEWVVWRLPVPDGEWEPFAATAEGVLWRRLGERTTPT